MSPVVKLCSYLVGEGILWWRIQAFTFAVQEPLNAGKLYLVLSFYFWFPLAGFYLRSNVYE